MMNAWNNADADGDGKLNLEEHKAWESAVRAIKQADGDWHESEHDQANYEILNSISEGEGYTFAEARAIMAPWMAKFEELKAADGL